MEETNKYIDFNCNLSVLANRLEQENSDELFEYISSVNISCGINGSSPLEIKNTVEKCKFKNKVIGASIDLPNDIYNPLDLKAEEIEAIVLYQLGALSAFTKAGGLNIEYIRPDGRLYQLTAENEDFSINVAKAIEKFSKWLLYYIPFGTAANAISSAVNLNLAREICLNKVYKENGEIDFSAENIKDTGIQLIRLRRLMNLSEIEYQEQKYAKVSFDTVHFDANSDNFDTLLKEAKTIVIPRPVNYNNTAGTGWVGINRNHYSQENNFEKINI